MIADFIFVGALAIFVGVIIGYWLSKSKRMLRLVNQEEKYKHSVLSNPDKIIEKLKKNGEMIDEGKKILPEFEYDDQGKIIDYKHEVLPVEVEKVSPTPLKTQKRAKSTQKRAKSTPH